MYEYKFTLDRIVDGDTLDANIDLGFDVVLAKKRIRLYGLNTPESRTRNLEEKKYGLAAKYRLTEILANATQTSVKTMKDKERGKYGRILGTIIADGVDVNQMLVDEGYAIAYFGGSKNTTEWWRNAEIAKKWGL